MLRHAAASEQPRSRRLSEGHASSAKPGRDPDSPPRGGARPRTQRSARCLPSRGRRRSLRHASTSAVMVPQTFRVLFATLQPASAPVGGLCDRTRRGVTAGRARTSLARRPHLVGVRETAKATYRTSATGDLRDSRRAKPCAAVRVARALKCSRARSAAATFSTTGPQAPSAGRALALEKPPLGGGRSGRGVEEERARFGSPRARRAFGPSPRRSHAPRPLFAPHAPARRVVRFACAPFVRLGALPRPCRVNPSLYPRRAAYVVLMTSDCTRQRAGARVDAVVGGCTRGSMLPSFDAASRQVTFA